MKHLLDSSRQIKMQAAIILLILAAAAYAVVPSISPELRSAVENGGAANVIVSFHEARVREIRNKVTQKSFSSRGARLTGIYNALKAHTDETQANVIALLNTVPSRESITVRQIWITNQIFVRGANKQVIRTLQSSPEVSEIHEELVLALYKPTQVKVQPEGQNPKADDESQWGVGKIEATSVWSTGVRGQGAVVASIDTGVRGSHAALRDNHRSFHGWYDAYEGLLTPYDDDGHGTHTMGTIVGTLYGIGVAPGAQWMACKGCDPLGCTQSALLECGQFVVCPTDTEGKKPDCNAAPDVVCNSWGGGQGDDWYDDVIATWIAGGIVPIFSQGNGGPECGTANYPGDSVLAIGVGSTNSSDVISDFSSVGPTLIGDRIKPDIAAPGSKVISSYYYSDNNYAELSGTSMAAPHVAGLVALLRSENPNITVSEIRSALEVGAVPTVPTGLNCGGISESSSPNNHVGYGRINAPRTLSAARKIASSKL